MLATTHVVLSPGNVLAWIIVGLIAGALAGLLTRGRGYGCLGDIVVGLLGSLLGGLLIGSFVHGSRVYHFIGTTLVALLGAIVLIVVLRLIRAIL